MKISIATIILVTIATNSIAQSLQFPKEITYYPKELKNEKEEYDGGRYTVAQDFHPIGWSPDGKFAYVQFYDEYVDGLTITVCVQDMTTDKTIWSTSSFNYDKAEDGTQNPKILLWKGIKNKAEKMLASYNIQQEKKIDYRKDSWHRLDGQAYKFDLTTDGNIQIDCRAKGLGQKTIYKQDISPDDFEYSFQGAYVTGIIKSPFEDRVIVLYSLKEKGFEFIDDLSFHLVGCHLLTDFK